jgi:hypothetical protein
LSSITDLFTGKVQSAEQKTLSDIMDLYSDSLPLTNILDQYSGYPDSSAHNAYTNITVLYSGHLFKATQNAYSSITHLYSGKVQSAEQKTLSNIMDLYLGIQRAQHTKHCLAYWFYVLTK